MHAALTNSNFGFVVGISNCWVPLLTNRPSQWGTVVSKKQHPPNHKLDYTVLFGSLW